MVETTSVMTTTIAMETEEANVIGAIPIDTMSIQNKIAEFDKIGVNFKQILLSFQTIYNFSYPNLTMRFW